MMPATSRLHTDRQYNEIYTHYVITNRLATLDTYKQKLRELWVHTETHIAHRAMARAIAAANSQLQQAYEFGVKKDIAAAELKLKRIQFNLAHVHD